MESDNSSGDDTIIIFTYPVSHSSVLVSHLTLKLKVLVSGKVTGVPDQLFAVTARDFYATDVIIK